MTPKKPAGQADTSRNPPGYWRPGRQCAPLACASYHRRFESRLEATAHLNKAYVREFGRSAHRDRVLVDGPAEQLIEPVRLLIAIGGW